MPSCHGCSKPLLKFDESINCSTCSALFHLSCGKLTSADKKSLIELGKRWSCTYCTSSRRLKRADVTVCSQPQAVPPTSDDSPITMKEFRLLMEKMELLSSNVVSIRDDLVGIKVTRCIFRLDEQEAGLVTQGETIQRLDSKVSTLSSELSVMKEEVTNIHMKSSVTHRHPLLQLIIRRLLIEYDDLRILLLVMSLRVLMAHLIAPLCSKLLTTSCRLSPSTLFILSSRFTLSHS